MRGNRAEIISFHASMRSIPAGAGEPPRAVWSNARYRVYPRGCGGTRFCRVCAPGVRGLSPRVRGNRPSIRFCALARGSIPAGAGEPRLTQKAGRDRRVYPRGCGGTRASALPWCFLRGLSPRVRGNREVSLLPGRKNGSIPAGAGEPDEENNWAVSHRVYPRGCGGTKPIGAPYLAERGLSPRVRGNRILVVRCSPRQGSIPAGAGEPCPAQLVNVRLGVYPRGCGGTRFCRVCAPGLRGLSPRVRGNRRLLWGLVYQRRVYPRGCGGT